MNRGLAPLQHLADGPDDSLTRLQGHGGQIGASAEDAVTGRAEVEERTARAAAGASRLHRSKFEFSDWVCGIRTGGRIFQHGHLLVWNVECSSWASRV